MNQHSLSSQCRHEVRDASPARKLAALALGIAVTATVFALADFAFGQFALARFPAPEQAAAWSRIGHFVAALLAVAGGVQAWRLVRRPR